MRVTISTEPDEAKKQALVDWLRQADAKQVDKIAGVAGSVDVIIEKFSLPDGGRLVVEQDNWIALSVEGDEKTIASLGKVFPLVVE